MSNAAYQPPDTANGLSIQLMVNKATVNLMSLSRLRGRSWFLSASSRMSSRPRASWCNSTCQSCGAAYGKPTWAAIVVRSLSALPSGTLIARNLLEALQLAKSDVVPVLHWLGRGPL